MNLAFLKNKTNPEDRKNLNIFLLFIGLFILLVVIIIIIFTVSIFNSANQDTGEGEPPEYTAYFNNRYVLTSNLDTNPGNEVSSHLETVVLNESERNSAPKENNSRSDNHVTYTININESSYLEDTSELGRLISVTAKVSDDREYELTILEDIYYGNYYLGTIIERTDKETTPFIFYDYNKNIEMFGEEVDYKSILENWANSYSLKNPIVDTSDLIINSK